jgi:hypothetical protein
MRTVTATRYVQPLREGGSLPALIEADDDGLYVLKFRGAGQGPKALVAELVAGEIGRLVGLPVPEIVLVAVDPSFGRTEPDGEIRELARASAGTNVGLDFLPGALGWEPALSPPPDPVLAAKVVWFDAFVTNVDRTARNPNLLLWHRELQLVDHGATLYFHHDWADHLARARSPFAAIKNHVLLPLAGDLVQADAELAPQVTDTALHEILARVPDDWLTEDTSPDAMRAGYVAHLRARLQAPRSFVEEAVSARAQLV